MPLPNGIINHKKAQNSVSESEKKRIPGKIIMALNKGAIQMDLNQPCRKNINGLRMALLAISILMALFSASCGQKMEQKAEKPPVPVKAGKVVMKQMPVQISVTGTVESSSTIAVRAQVGGLLTKVHFTEGQDVRKGDILFTIDQRPYEAALKQAEANLSRSRAQAENSRMEEKRYAELVKKGYVSRTQYDQVRTASEALEATMEADRAVAENARLNLSYCIIRSPIAGRTGSLMVHDGNLIKANADSPMVTINQIRPVSVSFSIPEKQLAEIRKYMASGTLKTEAFTSNDGSAPSEGRLEFMDNAVDPATGTIRLKGRFDNSSLRLWPGQFVNVLLTLHVEKDAVVVENRAVQTGQKGQFVFVIKEDSTAEMRPVILSRTAGNESVISKGLNPGEVVVTDGHLRLSPGAKIKVNDGADASDRDSRETGSGRTNKQ